MNKKPQLSLLLSVLLTLNLKGYGNKLNINELNKKIQYTETPIVQIIPRTFYMEDNILEYLIDYRNEYSELSYDDCIQAQEIPEEYYYNLEKSTNNSLSMILKAK